MEIIIKMTTKEEMNKAEPGLILCLISVLICFFLISCSGVKNMNSTLTPRDQTVYTEPKGRPPLPGNPESHYRLGCYYQIKGRDRQAIEEFKKVILIDPMDVKAYNRIGISYDRLKDFSKALIYYNRALRLNPNLYYVYNNEEFKSAAKPEEGLHMHDILATMAQDTSEKKGHEQMMMSTPVETPQGYLEETGERASYGKFGLIAPLSGPLSKYGEKMLRGVRMAIEEYNRKNGSSVDLIPFDSMARPDCAGKCVRLLAYKEKVAAIIGPLLSATSASAASVAQQIGIPLFTPTASELGLPDTGSFIFRNCLTNQDQVEALANYCVMEMGLTSFGVFSPSNVYGKEMTDLFCERIVALGAYVDIIEFYNPDDTDFKEQILRINQVKPEALFIPDSYKNIALIAPQISFYNQEEEEDEEPIQLLGTNGWYNEKLIKEAEYHINGAIISVGFYSQSMDERIRLFWSNFHTRYGEPPDLICAQSYDATNMLLEVSDGGLAPWAMIKDRLFKVQNFPSVSGVTTILPSGESKKEVTLLKIEGTRFVPVNQFHSKITQKIKFY